MLELKPALPVGGMLETVYETRTTTLARGDGLFVYSDGVTEATNAAREQYGDARLVQDLRALADARGRDVLNGIRERVREHCAGEPQADDLTALVMRWQPQ